MPLVDRVIANKLVMNGSQDMQTAVYSLKSGADNTTIMSIQHLEGGQAGALLELVNTFVPKIDQRLDSIALGLVSAANTASRTADYIGSDNPLTIFGFQVNSEKIPNASYGDITYDINGAADVPDQFGEPGINTDANMKNLYDFLSNPGNTLTLQGFKAANFISLAPADAAAYFDMMGDAIITSDAANLLQKQSAIFIGSSASLVTDVGVQVATWRSTQKADVAVMRNLKDQKDSLSGVNLDEEAANLLKYQQLYAASTKILQAGNQMFDTLLSIIN